MVSQYGTLTYRARSDGSPYAVINRARGIYTKLPDGGDRVGCGDVLYRVNDNPVLLLCGSTPAYRSLSEGDSGPDVAELNANLVHLGYATRAQLDPSSDSFGSETASALEKLQSRLGEDRTGSLDLGQAVFLPESVRIAEVTGELGGSARPGARVLSATSDTLEVQLALDPSQQGEVKTGDRAQITLPGNRVGDGDRSGRSAESPGSRSGPRDRAQRRRRPTIPAYISLDHPEQARGLDQAPVQVEITTEGVGERPERPGHRDRRELRRRVRGRGRARRRATRAGRREAGPVRHRRRTSPGRGRSSRRRSSGGAVVMSGESVLELDGVTKVYGEEPPVPALRGVSFSVRRGELVAIVGPSGSGKSTLLHVIGTLEQPSSGVVRIGGVDAARLSDRELSQLRAREIGFVFQQFFLAEHATVRENVADGLLYAGVPRRRAVRARGRGARTGRPLRTRELQAHQALRRGAAAGCDRPGPRRASGDRARRRADREPRQRHRRIDHRAHPRAQRRRRHHHHDHPRRGPRRSAASPDSGAGRPGGLRHRHARPRARRRREWRHERRGGRLPLKDGLRVASVGLRARPLRAALSALGIAIGTAAIVGVLGLSSSSQAGLIAEINRLGTNLLTVEAGQSLTGGPAQLPREAPARITLLDDVQLVAHTALMQDEYVYRSSMIPVGDTGGLAGAGRQPEPAVRARHRHRARRLAQRGHRPRAGRGARLGRRAAARHRPGLPRVSGSGWAASGSTSRAS